MPSLVIGVPGLWHSPVVPVEALAERGYLVTPEAGMVIDLKTRAPMPLFVDIYAPDPRMRPAFEAVAAGGIDEETLAKIDQHTMTIYVRTEEPHSLQSSQLVMDFATALVDVGGLGVKVETAGMAHSPQHWRDVQAIGAPMLTAFHALTVRNAAEDIDTVYSCGMQHLGLPDAVVPGATMEHVQLVDMFNKYLALENPELEDGHTFRLEQDGPRYRLRREPCTLFPADDLFHNPFGVWKLEPLVDDAKLEQPRVKPETSATRKSAKPEKKRASTSAKTSAKKAKSSAKKPKSSAKKAKSSAKKASSSAKKAKASASAKKAKSTAKKSKSSAKQKSSAKPVKKGASKKRK